MAAVAWPTNSVIQKPNGTVAVEWADSDLTDEVLEQFASTRLPVLLDKLPRLDSARAVECCVNLSGNQLCGPEAIGLLLRKLREAGVHVTALRLHKNQFGDAAAVALAEHLEEAAKAGRPLMQLHLSNNNLQEDGVRALIKAAHTCKGYPRPGNTPPLLSLGADGKRTALWLRPEKQQTPLEDAVGLLQRCEQSGYPVTILATKDSVVPPNAAVQMHPSFIGLSEQNIKGKGYESKGKGSSFDDNSKVYESKGKGKGSFLDCNSKGKGKGKIDGKGQMKGTIDVKGDAKGKGKGKDKDFVQGSDGKEKGSDGKGKGSDGKGKGSDGKGKGSDGKGSDGKGKIKGKDKSDSQLAKVEALEWLKERREQPGHQGQAFEAAWKAWCGAHRVNEMTKVERFESIMAFRASQEGLAESVAAPATKLSQPRAPMASPSLAPSTPAVPSKPSRSVGSTSSATEPRASPPLLVQAAASARELLERARDAGALQQALSRDREPGSDWQRLAFGGSQALRDACGQRAFDFAGALLGDEGVSQLIEDCSGRQGLADAFALLRLGDFLGINDDERQNASALSAVYGELSKGANAGRLHGGPVACQRAVLDVVFMAGVGRAFGGPAVSGGVVPPVQSSAVEEEEVLDLDAIAAAFGVSFDGPAPGTSSAAAKVTAMDDGGDGEIPSDEDATN